MQHFDHLILVQISAAEMSGPCLPAGHNSYCSVLHSQN